MHEIKSNENDITCKINISSQFFAFENVYNEQNLDLPKSFCKVQLGNERTKGLSYSNQDSIYKNYNWTTQSPT